MFDLKPKQAVEWSQDDLKRTQYGYLKSIRIHPGMFLWSFDLITRECRKVDNVTTEVGWDRKNKVHTRRNKVTVMPNTLYCTAINLKNALRKMQKHQLVMAIERLNSVTNEPGR